MKKILTFILLLAMVASLAGCAYLPDDMKSAIDSTIDSIKNGITGIIGGDAGNEEPHVHQFVLVDSNEPSCTRGGYEKSKCQCGEIQDTTLDPLGHDMQFFSQQVVNCNQYGSITYKCTRCDKKEDESVLPGQHEWCEVVEASRLVKCSREGCTGVTLAKGNGKYDETLSFTFGDAEKAVLAEKHARIESLLASVEKYDSASHAYAEEGALAEAYEEVYAIYEEYSDLIFSAQGQYSIAMTIYYCDNDNKDLETQYNNMQTYYTELVANFYSLSQPWYDSMFREFFFYGATEEEINAFLFDSNAYANPDYTALKDRNNAIELEYYNISDPISSTAVPELYAEFVENNNRIAALLGYDNYLEYAYENVYDRDYTYQEVDAFVEYVKEYIVPMYNLIYSKWGKIRGYTEADVEDYYSVVSYSFFENGKSNEMFNDYIDDMNMAFTSNPDKQISFSDNLNNLMADGNLFRGTYEGAYVTYIVDGDIPIAYFGDGYDNSVTIAHEFGHYMNEIYNMSDYDQSFDILETHSQGQEMLYISFVEDCVSAKAYELIETYQMLSTLSIIMSAIQVDCFEQAIYLNSYDGPNSDIIMADGKITSDEYDLLYASISEDLGIDESYRHDDYWRYGMTISSPCYYISYSISAINSLQLYADIHSDGFEAAKESYLKLFTYTDVDPDMTAEEVLIYAGLLSYNNEQTYVKINNFLKTI